MAENGRNDRQGKIRGHRGIYIGANNVGEAQILGELDNLIGQWAAERDGKECFGDFVIRKGVVAEVKVSKTDFHA